MIATQALEHDEHEPQPRRAALISMEWAAYLALAALALLLRIAQLDSVPMTSLEAERALSAWRAVYPQAAGAPITPDSPLLFALHFLSFSVLGASEFSARVFTALAGVGLIFTPLLFRDLFGRTRAFMFCLLLAFSPILLAASRSDSPVIWMLLAAAFTLWGLRRYRLTAQPRYAVTALVCGAAMIFLTDPAGLFVALVLLLAALFARWIGARAEAGPEDSGLAQEPLSAFRDLPWREGLPQAALLIFIISTVFMLNPGGLSAVGELLNAGISGLTTARPQIPTAFPISITLFYEPVTAALGVGALWWLNRWQRLAAVDRFLLGLVSFSALLSLVYAGAGAEHALWLSLPLAGLGSALAAEALSKPRETLIWRAPEWSRWMLAIIMVALLSMFAIHAQSLGRSLLFVSDNSFNLASLNSISLIWVVIIILFIVIGCFLAAGIWGAGMTARGALLGTLAFALVTSLGGGWRAAVEAADNPVELWNRQATSADTQLLRATLLELANRETSGFPRIAVTALAPDDGVVAWLLRDFPNTRFVSDAIAARTQEIVLLPAALENPDLGGSYVGQRFVITSTWNTRDVRFLDFLGWWLQRRTRTGGVPSETMVLWLRQDVYQGVPFEPG